MHRFALCALTLPTLATCNARHLAPPRPAPGQAQQVSFPVTLNRDIDILFLIDDSLSMRPLQEKLARRLPDFMNVLGGLRGGLPNLHVAVVSSSLGAGTYGNVPGCGPGGPGNRDGKFQHAASCAALDPGQTFIRSNGGMNNFTGAIADVFSCIALIGDGGCGFEHPFEATQLALAKAANPGDPDNGGFLRPPAYLGIILVTNEDDCSVAYDSTLFDPAELSVRQPLGGLQSYRCNEFGHLCGGQRPPHEVTAAVTLDACVSAEGAGRLTTVSGFVDFVKSLKSDPERIFVAALAGPNAPYVVEPRAFQLPDGTTEMQPSVRHSCTAANGDYADPGVRVRNWVDAFGDHGVFESICADDFQPAMVRIAEELSRGITPPCLQDLVLTTDEGRPDCRVTISATTDVPMCAAGGSSYPCWRFDPVVDAECASGQRVQVCWDGACDPTRAPPDVGSAKVTCAVSP